MVLKNGLSRMRGDSHVRFLGGGGAAMRRCYPTVYKDEGNSKPAQFAPHYACIGKRNAQAGGPETAEGLKDGCQMAKLDEIKLDAERHSLTARPRS